MFVLLENEVIKLQTDGRYRGMPGVLTLTNRRVVFTKPRSRVTHKVDTALSIPLEAIDTVVEHPHAQDVTVEISAEGAGYAGPRAVEVRVPALVHVAPAIERLARSARSHPPSPSPLTGPVHVHVQVPAAVPAVVYVRCSFCRTVFPELDAKCPSCGAPF